MHELPPDLLKRIHAHSHYRDVDYARLAAHYGTDFLIRRLERQLDIYDLAHYYQSHGLLRWRKPAYRRGLKAGLWMAGQLARSRHLARSPVWVEREVWLPDLPRAFDGFRILHLTDFHFDYTPELAEIVREKLKGAEFDVCVLTGDYRGEDYGPYEESLTALETVRSALGDAVYAVLGNHDSIEIMLRLPEMGIRGLVNEAVWLERSGERILLAGVDDGHWYRTHDFAALRPQMEEAEVTVLLSHTPELFREAAVAGADVMLSGHTHGGQLCLPGGFPLVAHVKNTPRAMIRGAWRWGSMQGYTSRGAGTSSIDCRLFCPGEISLHVLRVKGNE
jgi:predicted MPP superfamily phosphohydrolase